MGVQETSAAVHIIDINRGPERLEYISGAYPCTDKLNRRSVHLDNLHIRQRDL